MWRGGREGEWRVCFWNVAGLRNKDKGFWREVLKWDVIVFMETWIKEKEWRKFRDGMPKSFKWGVQFAERRSRKGRAMRGIVMGIRWDLVERGSEIKVGKEGVIVGKIRLKEEIMRIVGVYVNGDLELKLGYLKDWMEGREEGVLTIIGGDFNARTGNRRGIWSGIGEKQEETGRRSKDLKINRDRKRLIEFIEERGWSVFNGRVKGDEEGEYTFTGGKGTRL